MSGLAVPGGVGELSDDLARARARARAGADDVGVVDELRKCLPGVCPADMVGAGRPA